ncbi:TPA: aconitase [Escherichia coli]|nr:aconitase [Escherichia coli]HAV8423935.1 aconitase [Escherichia coli]HAW0760461.1 aconitase [Escherichia coli]
MIKLSEKGVFLASNNEIIAEEHFTGEIKKEEAKKGTILPGLFSLRIIRPEIWINLKLSLIH